MNGERPLEIDYVPPRLHEVFDGKVYPVGGNNADERERNFLTRALAAYAIHKLAGASADDAAKCIVDGGGDGGIDGIHYAASNKILWLVQSKFIASGTGEPSLGDFTKFIAGLGNMLSGNFDAFKDNKAIKNLISNLRVWFADSALQIRPVLVYTSTSLISEDRRQEVENLKARFSAEDEYLDFTCCNLTTIHDWVTGGDKSPGVDVVELTLQKPGRVTEPYESVYGLLPLTEVAALFERHGKQLIAANIRGFKGRTEVNDEIVKTAKSEPENFLYLNNGLTAYCDRLEVHNLDRANVAQKRIMARGFSIVNGAQTLGSIARACSTSKSTTVKKANPAGHVFVRIISLEKCTDERAFAQRITRSTNFQNRVELLDFAAQLDLHELWARQLSPSGIHYHFKVDANTPDAGDTNFDIKEAMTACACLIQGSDWRDFVSRLLSNRASLWSFEQVYPEAAGIRTRCERIFRADRSARTVWRAVQTQRLVVSALREAARSETGVRKDFLENARWLLLGIIFLRLHPERGENLALSDAERTVVSVATNTFAEFLFQECEAKGFVTREEIAGTTTFKSTKHMRSIFSASGDCQLLRDGLLSRIAKAEVSATKARPGEST